MSRLTETDRAEWARFAQLIRPLPGRTRPPVSAPAPDSVAPALPAPRAALVPRARPRAPHPTLPIGAAPPGLDTATWQRFRSGRLAPSRTLDLHAHTAQRAALALRAFLHTAAADRLRCVEVITGRGSGEQGGVLKREVPLWLNLPDLRPLVLAATHPHPANPGSLRLLLRRPGRSPPGTSAINPHPGADRP